MLFMKNIRWKGSMKNCSYLPAISTVARLEYDEALQRSTQPSAAQRLNNRGHKFSVDS